MSSRTRELILGRTHTTRSRKETIHELFRRQNNQLANVFLTFYQRALRSEFSFIESSTRERETKTRLGDGKVAPECRTVAAKQKVLPRLCR